MILHRQNDKAINNLSAAAMKHAFKDSQHLTLTTFMLETAGDQPHNIHKNNYHIPAFKYTLLSGHYRKVS